jgi:hypothetical protein
MKSRIVFVGVECHFQQNFSYIVVISLIDGGKQSSGENHRPAASNRLKIASNLNRKF